MFMVVKMMKRLEDGGGSHDFWTHTKVCFDRIYCTVIRPDLGNVTSGWGRFKARWNRSLTLFWLVVIAVGLGFSRMAAGFSKDKLTDISYTKTFSTEPLHTPRDFSDYMVYPRYKGMDNDGKSYDQIYWDPVDGKLDLLYTCEDSFGNQNDCDRFANKVVTAFGTGTQWGLRARPMSNFEQMTNQAVFYANKTFAGLQMRGPNKYNLLMNGDHTPSAEPTYVAYRSNQLAYNTTYAMYEDSGYVLMQRIINEALGGSIGANNIQRMPVVDWQTLKKDYDWQESFWPVFMIFLGLGIAWTYVCTIIVQDKVDEIFRGFMLMGLNRWSYYFSWFIFGTMIMCALYIIPLSGKWSKTVQIILSLNPFWLVMQMADVGNHYDADLVHLGFHNIMESGLGWGWVSSAASNLYWFWWLTRVLAAPSAIRGVADVNQDYNEENFENFTGEHADRRAVGMEDNYDESKRIVSIQNLTHMYHVGWIQRMFGKKTPKVVNGLSIDLYKGECYGLLGHNGAGKTTSIACISGEIPFSGGKVSYRDDHGNWINLSARNMNSIRPLVGVCPQKDLVIDQMTGREHIEMFCKIKGVSLDEVDGIIHMVNLDECSDRRVEQYSGGMKRRVGLAMALVGKPKVMFLDEPTAGMDPVNRRDMWEAINRVKKNGDCAVVLTTHFMDEADLLSDRIGIMNHGRLICEGTGLFLKHRFGAGYNLRINDATARDDQMVMTEVPDAEKQGSLEWSLPYGNVKNFPALLQKLKGRSFRLTLTTLEEVFLRTADLNEKMKTDIIKAMSTRDLSVADEGPRGRSPGVASRRVGSDDHVSAVQAAYGRARANSLGDGDNDDLEEGSKEPLLGMQTENRSFWRSMRALYWIYIVEFLRLPQAFIFGYCLPVVFVVVGFIISKYAIDPPKYFQQPQPVALSGLSAPQGPQADSAGYLAPSGWIPQQCPATSDMIPPGPITKDGLLGCISGGTIFYNSSQVSALPYMIQHATSGASIDVEMQGLPYVKWAVNWQNQILPLLLSLGFASILLIVPRLTLYKQLKVLMQLKTWGIGLRKVYFSFVSCILLIQCIPILCISLIFAGAFNTAILGDGGRWLAYLVCYVLFLYAAIPICLAVLPLFKDIKQAGGIFPTVWNLQSWAPFIPWAILMSNGSESSRHAAEVMSNILSFMPLWGFEAAVIRIMSLNDDVVPEVVKKADGTTEINVVHPDVTWSMTFKADKPIMITIYWALGVGLIFWIIVWWQTRLKAQLSKQLRPDALNALAYPEPKDTDLLEEEKKAEVAMTKKDTVAALHVDQTFDRETLVLDDVTMAVGQGELCVLLGPNGAGKTTLMNILVGELNPSSGKHILGGHDAVTPGSCGLCPQFDALFPFCTVAEQCRLVEDLKGIPRDSALPMIEALDLKQYMKTKTKDLSGGNKRKLSFALALLGRPSVLVLDEPSTGVDPASRRLMWDVLKSQPQAVILSTHVMEEAEALATKIVIQMNGRTQVSGSVEELIKRFCNHLVVVGRSNQAGVEKLVMKEIGGACKLIELNAGTFTIQVPLAGSDMAVVMGRLFQVMEKNKKVWDIMQYSISQTTLNHVFLQLARVPLHPSRHIDSDSPMSPRELRAAGQASPKKHVEPDNLMDEKNKFQLENQAGIANESDDLI